MSKISVIIPYFNRSSYLPYAVDSVFNQEGVDIEVIIVDDGSTVPLETQRFSTPSLADRRVRIIRQENCGPSKARNTALDAAVGEYVLLLDSDDYLEPGSLRKLSSALEENKCHGAVGGWRDFNSSGTLHLKIPKPFYSDALANCVKQDWISGCVLLRSDEQCRFNTRRMPWEVTEFYLDYLQDTSRNVAYVPSLVIHARQDATERLTTRHDHFEPAMGARFWSEMKQKLEDCGQLTLERASALDFKILANVHTLLRARRVTEGRELAESVSWQRIENYPWYRFGSFAWFCKRGGVGFGGDLFFAMNRILCLV